MSSISPVPVNSLKERLRIVMKVYQLRARVRAISGERRFNPEVRVSSWVRALWLSAGRSLSVSLSAELKAWERIIEANEIPSDLLKGLCNMYLGLHAEVFTVKTNEEFEQLLGPRYEGWKAFTEVADFYEKSRPQLQMRMRAHYRSRSANPKLPLITAPGWIPDEPILMTGRGGSEPKFRFENGDPREQPVLPTVPGLEEPLHEVRQTLNSHSEMRNGETYRPLEIAIGAKGLLLTCGAGSYFDYHDTCEILGIELAAWMLADRRERERLLRETGINHPECALREDGTDLPMRTQVDDIFNLRNRCCVLGVSTMLIGLDRNKRGHYYWHQRGQEVAVNPGARSVVPSGTFEPFSSNFGSYPDDFRLTATVLREFAEELLGADDFNEPGRHAASIETKAPQLRPFIDQLKDGRATIHFLGIGFDPVTTVPEALTVLVFREDHLTPDNFDGFKPNFEGEFGKANLSAEALRIFASLPNVHSASSACASLVARHYDMLILGQRPSRAA